MTRTPTPDPQAEIARLSAALAVRFRELALLQTDLAAQQAETERLMSELRTLDRDRNKALAEIKAQAARIKTMGNDLAQAKARADHLKKSLARLQRSASWRVTAPLRWIGARLRRARGT